MHGLLSTTVLSIWNVAAIFFPGQQNSETEHKWKLVGKILAKKGEAKPLHRSAMEIVLLTLNTCFSESAPHFTPSIAFLSQRLPGFTSFTSVQQDQLVDWQHAPAFSEEMHRQNVEKRSQLDSWTSSGTTRPTKMSKVSTCSPLGKAVNPGTLPLKDHFECLGLTLQHTKDRRKRHKIVYQYT